MIGVPTSNAEFLAAIFNTLPEGARPLLCGFAGNPLDKTDLGRKWRSWPWAAGAATDNPALNWYFTLGVFRPNDQGRFQRRADNCAAIYGVLADDIGTKAADLSRLAALPPSVLTMTSAGNYQALYLFDQPTTDFAAVDALQRSLIEGGLCDRGATGPAARNCRMPFGVNGKHSPTQPCYLIEWRPKLRYSLGEIRQGLGLPAPQVRSVAPTRANEWEAKTPQDQDRSIAELRSALAAIPSDDRDEWVAMGHALRTLPDAIGYALFDEWSRKSAKFDDEGLDDFWTFDPTRTNYAAVFARAEKFGWVNPRKRTEIDAARVGFGGAELPAGASLTPVPKAASSVAHETLFSASAKGWIDSTIENVSDALVSKESGARIGLDSFLEHVMIASANGAWRPFTDSDYGRMRAEFGRRGFKPVTPEIMKTAVLMTAEANRFDSAQQWANGLKWDGAPRIDTLLPTYYRTVDTLYTRAVGAYIFTALAARALVPGAQVDMVPVFVGLQGERKTSAVRALCPDPRFFCEINLKKIDDDNMARRVRGRLVGEIAELRGLAGRDQESLKAWITRREEQWRSLYREFETTYPRRLVLIGTANEREFLDDPTGERRWLPVAAGTADVEGIERDREQLWAEGVARFKVSGVAWREAEQLARAEHARYKVTDPWAEAIENWLALRGGAPFIMSELAFNALHKTPGMMQTPDHKRIAKVLRTLGYDKADARVAGRTVNLWSRVL